MRAALLGFTRALTFLLLWCMNVWPVDASAGSGAIQRLERASLSALSGERDVQLPHVLESADFPSAGGTVKYHLDFDLPDMLDMPLGIYIPKISLSGRLYLNGHLAATCGNARLEHLRCLHQPQFYKIPAALLRPGQNTLVIEVYATPRQNNGLSVVHLGDADVVYETLYSWRHFITAELQMGLIYLSALLGVAALIASMVLHEKNLFIWYGLVCLMNAVASLNGVVTNPHVDGDFFNWLVFSSRFASAILAYVLLLSIFKAGKPFFIRILLSYLAFSLLVIFISGSDRKIVMALYAPLMLLGFPIIYMAARGIYKMKGTGYWINAAILLIMFACGVVDFYKLTGASAFDQIYLLPYANGFAMVSMGLFLIYRISKELVDSQKSTALLQQQIDQRSAFELTQHIPVGTYTMRLAPGKSQAQYTFLSQRFVVLTGLDPEQVYRDPDHVFAVLHPDDKEAWIQAHKQSVEKKSTFAGRARIVVHGQLRWVVAEAIPRQLADGSTIWEGVLTDETGEVMARQKAEQDRLAWQTHLMEKSRLEEREQLLRDVHDGFGSQLASVRMMVENGYVQSHKLSHYLQELSADLHLVVDTLGQPDVTLEEAFYDMRYRTNHYFSKSNIQFDWVISLQHLPFVEPRATLQIQRIVQEAIHNAVRHAHAQRVVIQVMYSPDAGVLRASVSDDGIGMPTDPPKGRGLSNMRHRARSVHGMLQISRLQPGTDVSLTVNLAHSHAVKG